MYWNKIKECLIKYGEPEEWSLDWMAIESHDGICGLNIKNKKGNIDISVISHKLSYGGKDDLFEIMPGLDGGENSVDGYLTEEEAIRNIKIIMDAKVR